MSMRRERRYIYALNMGGTQGPACVGLAQIAQDPGQTVKARSLIFFFFFFCDK